MNRRQFSKAGLGALSFATMATTPLSAAGDALITKAVPSSGELLPVIGLGTNRYGVGDAEDARRPLRTALQRFHELGGTVIDTAPMYRSSESVLGDLIAELGIRKDLFVATKTDKSSSTDTDAQMQTSTHRLRANTFELMQVHNLRGWRTALPVMREWQQGGRIRYVGITTSRRNQYEEFEKILATEPLDFVQINYSLEDREAAKRILPLAADRGVAVIVNRSFGGGRLFDALGEKPLPDWAQDFDCSSWAQFLLKYAVGHPAVTLSIPGMAKLRHVDDNLAAARGRLPTAAERRRQEALFDAI